MTIPKLLDRLADVAEIATGAVAVWAWYRYRKMYRGKVKELETELRRVWADGPKRAGRTINHLIVKTGLTEKEILQASLDSHYIMRIPHHGPDGKTEKILLVYDAEGEQNR